MSQSGNNGRGRRKGRFNSWIMRVVAVCGILVSLAVAFASPMPSVVPGYDGGSPTGASEPGVSSSYSAYSSGPASEEPDRGASAMSSDSSGQVEPSSAVISDGEDGIATEHEAGVVLAKLPENATADELNAAIAQFDFLAPQTVSRDDAVLGWVELTLAEGVSVPDAMQALRESGAFDASQPNYVYRLVDDRQGGNLQPGQVNGDFPPKTEPTGESYDTREYFKFVNDQHVNNQTAVYTVQMNEAYNFLYDHGYVTEAGVGKEAGPLQWTGWEGDAAARPTVAVLDTGCFIGHNDLKNNIVDYYDAVRQTKDDFEDIDGHGTHVCGIVSAEMNNTLGIVGMSFNANVMPVNVFAWSNGDLGADSKDIARGYEYVFEHAEELNVRVVNLSLGAKTEEADEDDKLFLEAIETAYQRDILTVIAAGNDGVSGAYTDFPADFSPNAVSVIDCAISDAVQDSGNPWGLVIIQSRVSYSNYNKPGTMAKQLCALGDSVLSTLRNGRYGWKSGTSMAAPCVAGIAALALQVDPSLDVDQLKSLLYSTADDVAVPSSNSSFTDEAAPGFDAYTGFGTMNAYRAAVAADERSYLSIVEGGETTVPVLATGDLGASTIRYTAPVKDGVVWSWSTSDENIASVDGNGLVTAIGPGQAIITAQSGEDEDAIELYSIVTVYELTDSAIAGPDQVEYGATVTLTCDVAPSFSTWRWGSDNEDAVEVGQWSGVVKGKAVNGSATITAQLVSNPDISVSKRVSVKQASLSGASIALSSSSFTYNGSIQKPTVKTVGGKALASSDYDVRYSNASSTNAGSYTVSVAGKGNYTGTSATATYTIGKRSLAQAAVSSIPAQAYTGKAVQPQPTVTLEGKTLRKGTDYELSYSNNVNAGNAAVVKVSGIGNYTGSKDVTFTISAPPSAPAANSAPAAEPDPALASEPAVEPAVEPVAKSAAPVRLQGDVALDTMAAIVNEGWSGKPGGVVVLTTLDGYWDALTAAGVAGMAKAPVLMTDAFELSPQAEAIISSLKPATVVVCGGSAAVSEGAAWSACEAAGGARLVRCWGQTATGTAVDCYQSAVSEGLGSWSATAFVCTNDGYWDALAAAPISYAKAMPIFLTEGRSDISDETLSAMRAGGVGTAYIVGGEAAIDDAVKSRLESAGIQVAGRLWGDTAVETSERVAEFGLSHGMGCSKIGVATTDGYWDALAGAPLCGLNNSVLVLAGDAGAHSISGFVNSHKSQVAICYVFGGEAAIDADTYQALQGAIS